MATNPWVSQSVRNEQDLYEDLVIESLKFYGQDVYYIPREIVNKDKVFLDDVPSRFSDAYKIEMYAENIEGFEGEGDLFSKFGVELRDQATFVVARRRWKKLVGDKLDSYNFRPREGDLIYLPLSQSIFEIFKVETETPFYQLSQLPTFRLQCELFEYNDEDFDTDIDDIDIVESESAYQYKLTMKSPADATATATASLDVDGRVSSVIITDPGSGYSSVPTATITENLGGNSKFGNSSLNTFLNRGVETNYKRQGNYGTIELWAYFRSYPSNRASLFLTGGEGDASPEKEYMWGIDDNGQLIYSRGDNQGAGIQIPTSSIVFQLNTWHHLLVGVSDSDNLFIYFDFEKKYDSDLTGSDFNWFTSDRFSLGATAARTLDGIQWDAMNGYIDEFRATIGNRNTILVPRYLDSGDTLITQTAEWDSDGTTAYLDHFNATSASVTAVLDSATGTISSVNIDNSGFGYITNPTITLSVPYAGGNYVVGETVQQSQNGFTMEGEVSAWSDSDNVLYLAHVGATDGLYHNFNTTNPVVGNDATFAPSLVEEIQNIERVDTGISQNTYFDNFEADFLDFSESNPFGDMQ